MERSAQELCHIGYSYGISELTQRGFLQTFVYKMTPLAMEKQSY